ncbi:mcm domain-containing protein 2 [Plakobranchus ocellatus]|uniref:Mcm domain-containing protein 2 n=1 Tax=Plakobranchus ocellatus TaxID=259542 RepID=A0AAV4ANP1_9GAST|nr:mcm domain-containing protein 2 [Plakobranchus ocellatus]
MEGKAEKEEIGKRRIKEDGERKGKEKKVCLVYNFNIIIDIGLVFDFDAALGDSILSKPLECASLFQEIVFQFCLRQRLLPLETTPTQICAQLRIVSLPSGCDSLHVCTISNLHKCIDYSGYVQVTGVVTGMSGPAKYTQSTKYVCPEKSCEGSEGNHFIRMHSPGASEDQTIRNDFRCTFCGDVLIEVTSFRTLSDKILIEITPIILVGPAQKEIFKPGCVQPIPVFVRDELLDKVTLGDACQIVGIARTDVSGEGIGVTLEAHVSNGLFASTLDLKEDILIAGEDEENELLDKVTLGDACQIVGIARTDVNGEGIGVTLENKWVTWLQKPSRGSICVLPEAIQTIFEVTKHSPWSFPLNMAYHFGDKIVVGGTMIKLRLLLLVSLVLNPKNHLLHILTVGRETSLVIRLLHHALKFSLRSFSAMVGMPLCGKITNEGCYSWAPYFMQAGVLPLCSGGVCMSGDLGPWKKQQQKQLKASLSSSKIFLDIASKHMGDLSQLYSLVLQCHVWAVYSPLTSGAKGACHNDDVLYESSTGDLSKSFLDTFSYICLLDGGNSFVDEEIYIQMCNQTVLSWCAHDETKPAVQQEDMDAYVSMARQLEPEMTSAGETLIQSYYTAVRVARSSGLSGSDVPGSAIATL